MEAVVETLAVRLAAILDKIRSSWSSDWVYDGIDERYENYVDENEMEEAQNELAKIIDELNAKEVK
jgi:hypothetical protein